MTSPPMRGRRRGLRPILWTSPLWGAVLLFGIFNLWLSSPPGGFWISEKIQRATGIEITVGGASVTPWNGITLNRIEIPQPAPLRASIHSPMLHVRHVTIRPAWSSWIRGITEVHSIELDSPSCVVAAECLNSIVQPHTATPPQTTPPAQAANPPPLIQAPPALAATPPSQAAPAPATPPTAPQVPPQPPAQAQPPTVWIHLKHASFSLVSASTGSNWIDLSEINASIPVAGKEARSRIESAELRFKGKPVTPPLKASLVWQAPALTLEPMETELCGIRLIAAAKIARLSGLPAHVVFQIPKQKTTSLTLPGQSSASAESIAADAQWIGLLLQPATWQGNLLTEAIAPSGSVLGHPVAFDRASSVTILRGGQLSCLDARLISDDLSLLGNATVLANGRVAAALRLVATPETTTHIVNRAFPKLGTPPSLTPLSTPQRAAFDLEVFGDVRQTFLKLGIEGPVVNLHTLAPP